MPWDFDNTRPIYTQLLDRVQMMIVSGEYQPGDKLPSVREFAAEAGVNPNTMQRAMAELERIGLVYSNRTSGRMITDNKKRIEELKMTTALESLQAFIEDMKKLGYGKEDILQMIEKNY